MIGEKRDNKGRFIKNHLPVGDTGKIYISKEKLEELYINQDLNSEKCGEILNCSQTPILRCLKEYGIKIRPAGCQKGYSSSVKTQFKKGNHYSIATEFKKGQFAKENHPLWKGGISSLYDKIKQTDKYKLWRNEVYKRDYWTCQICGKHCEGKDIIAHHKKSFSEYPESRFDINNGITLCRNCHAKIHNYNGSFIPKGELAICL